MSKVETLEPVFQGKVVELLKRAEAATGMQWVITSARRTMAEQQALYDQGRKNDKPVVTKAPPGSSAHNFGLAVDLAPIKDGKIWWEAPKTKWKVMADTAQSMGLVAGYYFKTIFDAPHVEDKSWKQQQAMWREGKITVA